MANIYDLANELEREIRVLPEYKKHKSVAQQLTAMLKQKLCSKNLLNFNKDFMQNYNLVKCLQVMSKLKCKNWVQN